MKISKVLPELLARNGVSLSHLAKETGVPKSSLFDWTTGRVPRNLNDVKKISSYFEVSLHYLLFGQEDPLVHPVAGQEEDQKDTDLNAFLRRNWSSQVVGNLVRKYFD